MASPERESSTAAPVAASILGRRQSHHSHSEVSYSSEFTRARHPASRSPGHQERRGAKGHAAANSDLEMATMREDSEEEGFDGLVSNAHDASHGETAFSRGCSGGASSGSDRDDREHHHHHHHHHHQSASSPSSAATAAHEAPVAKCKVVLLILGHSISSSLLLVVNKWALQVFPYIWVLTTLQFLPTALLVLALSKLDVMEVDALEEGKLLAFLPAAGMLFITLTAGNAVVKHTNVDSFVVVRSLVPIPCALLETVALGEPCPRPASWLGLAVLLGGAVLYASANKGVSLQSGSWIALFLIMMPINGVLIKHLINTTGLKTTWGLVLYQNLLAGGLGLLCTFALELSSPASWVDATGRLAHGGAAVWIPVLFSTALGISVSFFQMSVRKVVSSTAFMVLGVSNKLLAVFINQLAMEANSSLTSIGGVIISIGGAVGFQQTVKGNGISQAKAPAASTTPQLSNSIRAILVMFIGLIWASILTIMDKDPERLSGLGLSKIRPPSWHRFGDM